MCKLSGGDLFKSSDFPEGLDLRSGEIWWRELVAPRLVVGVDEAGRGPLAGPVVAAAVILQDSDPLQTLRDSKKLSAKKRDELFPVICAHSYYAIAQATPAEIDDINILEATFLAMRRALQGLGFAHFTPPAPRKAQILQANPLPHSAAMFAVVDGNLSIKGVEPAWQKSVVKGDDRVLSIAAASVLAKVVRDNIMAEIAEQYPQYGMAQHKGYPTKAHKLAIQEYGYTPHHRRSFRV